jgi:peptide-methionine (S)-S-oxide reductase
MNRALLTLLLFLPSFGLAGQNTATAIFAGGCFWCMESDFQGREGVVDVISGFAGGTLENPTYSGNHEGHLEVVQITYNPKVLSYQDLLNAYWPSIDPFDGKGQFCDKGFSYRSAVFHASESEKRLAEESLRQIQERFPGQKVQTEILSATKFWPVEDYHQDYYLKNPTRYKYYRWRCGRDQRLKEIWGEPASAQH